jgi:hypothetical protein
MRTPRLAAAAAFVLAVALGSGIAASSPALAKEPCTKTTRGTCLKSGFYACQAVFVNPEGKYQIVVQGGQARKGYFKVRGGRVTEINAPADVLGWDANPDLVYKKHLFRNLIRITDRETYSSYRFAENRFAFVCKRKRASASATGASSRRSTGISWREAGSHVGTSQRVCGPFAGTGSSGDDVFLNLGRNYPDPERFQIVLWDVGAVESIRFGAKVCATGRISVFRGVPQIELQSVRGVTVSR